MSVAEQKCEEAHALLTKIMDDVGELLPYRAIVEWWLEANAPTVSNEPPGRLEVVR